MEQHNVFGGPIAPIEELKEPIVNQQVVYNRLPQNYFMQDAEEQMDLDMAMSDIKRMREGFVTYVNEQNAGEQVAEITDILDPQKFIERHFGDEDPDFLFQEVLKEVPEPMIPPVSLDIQEEPAPEQELQQDQLERAEEAALSEQPVAVVPGGGLWDDPKEADPPAPLAAAQESNLITGETQLKDPKTVE